jgi:hypothetical protein
MHPTVLYLFDALAYGLPHRLGRTGHHYQEDQSAFHSVIRLLTKKKSFLTRTFNKIKLSKIADNYIAIMEAIEQQKAVQMKQERLRAEKAKKRFNEFEQENRFVPILLTNMIWIFTNVMRFIDSISTREKP